MRRRLVLGAVALLVVLAAIGTFVFWPRGSTPITAEEALEDFRDRAGRETESEVDDPVEGDDRLPAAGVYRYRATGGESVKLGALPAEDRPYPEELTAVVVVEDGCFRFTLNLLAQHTEETTYCPGAGQELTLRDHVKHQQVGALRPEAEMSCDPGLLHELSRSAQELRCTLSMAGGPARLGAQLAGTSTAEVPSSVEVAGEQHEAVKLDLRYDITGDLTGTWRELIWFGTDWTPLRIERDLELQGLATFTEHSELVLVDRTPEI